MKVAFVLLLILFALLGRTQARNMISPSPGQQDISQAHVPSPPEQQDSPQAQVPPPTEQQDISQAHVPSPTEQQESPQAQVPPPTEQNSLQACMFDENSWAQRHHWYRFYDYCWGVSILFLDLSDLTFSKILTMTNQFIYKLLFQCLEFGTKAVIVLAVVRFLLPKRFKSNGNQIRLTIDLST